MSSSRTTRLIDTSFNSILLSAMACMRWNRMKVDACEADDRSDVVVWDDATSERTVFCQARSVASRISRVLDLKLPSQYNNSCQFSDDPIMRQTKNRRHQETSRVMPSRSRRVEKVGTGICIRKTFVPSRKVRLTLHLMFIRK